MFCILPCATIKDKVTLSPVGPAANIAKQMDEARSELRKLSDMDYLLPKLQEGDVVMTRKVSFDNYLAAHVDLMRAYVSTFTPCNFIYSSFFGGPEIDTTGMGQKDQWALQIVVSRYNLSSIYHAGAYNNMRTIFTDTAASYRENAHPSGELVKNIQITFQYFNEGYQPLKRLLPYFDAVESLSSSQSRGKYLEVNKIMFEVYTHMVTCNLAFLKIEKCRQLREFKKCKEACWAVYLRICDCKAKLSSLGRSLEGSSKQICQFFDLGAYFYQILTYYYLLMEHEDNKNKEEYGFIKKEFQQMIHDNLAACEEAEKLDAEARARLRQENDNVLFGLGVLTVVIEEIRKFKYRYDINVHENKMERPHIKNVIGRRVGASNIWTSLDFF